MLRGFGVGLTEGSEFYRWGNRLECQWTPKTEAAAWGISSSPGVSGSGIVMSDPDLSLGQGAMGFAHLCKIRDLRGKMGSAGRER